MPAQSEKYTDEHCQNQNSRQLIEQSGHLFLSGEIWKCSIYLGRFNFSHLRVQ
jgi:hypothetical protein